MRRACYRIWTNGTDTVAHELDELGVSRANVRGAAALALTVHPFDGLAGVRTALRRVGVPVAN